MKVKSFYAVTLNAIYFITEEKEGIIIKKISRRNESTLPLGTEFFGPNLLISKKLVLFNPYQNVINVFRGKVNEVDTNFWKENPSLITGLFMDLEKAEECFNSNSVDLHDLRWVERTKDVLQKIGDDHGTFFVCKYKDMSLL